MVARRSSHQLRLDQLGAAFGIEALYLFPWLWIGMVGLLVKLIRRGPRAWDKNESFLICQAAPALVLFHAIAAQRRIMPYWPLFGFIALMPLLGRAWAEGLKTHPAVRRRWIAAVAAIPGLAGGSRLGIQARFGLLEDSQGRLLGLIAPKHDPTADTDLLGPGRERARATRTPHRAANLPVHRLVGSQRRARPRHARQSPGGLLPPRTAELLILEPSRRLGGPRRNLRRERASPRHCRRITTSFSRDMNRSAPCESSAAAFSFARSTSTAAPIRPGHSPSMAASEIRSRPGKRATARPQGLSIRQLRKA